MLWSLLFGYAPIGANEATSFGFSRLLCHRGGLRHLSHASDLSRARSLLPSMHAVRLWRYRLPLRDGDLMRKREREIERPSVYDSGNDESSSTSKSVPIVSTRGALAKGKCHYHTLSTMCFAVGRLALRIYSTKYLSSLFILSHSSSLSLFFSDTCILNVETKRERVGKSGD